MRFLAALLFFLAAAAQAAVGLTELPGIDGNGPVTVFYPSSGEAKPLKRGPFTLTLAWQGVAPRFHGEAVLRACSTCTSVASLPNGGHGALLSPFPPKLPEAAAELLNDPPGFDRSVLPEVDRKISAFFLKHLLPYAPSSASSARFLSRPPA